jgi:Protein of unknown function (DUF2637)
MGTKGEFVYNDPTYSLPYGAYPDQAMYPDHEGYFHDGYAHDGYPEEDPVARPASVSVPGRLQDAAPRGPRHAAPLRQEQAAKIEDGYFETPVFDAAPFDVTAFDAAPFDGVGVQWDPDAELTQFLQTSGLHLSGLQAPGIQTQSIQAPGIQTQGIQTQGIHAPGIQAPGPTGLHAPPAQGVHAAQPRAATQTAPPATAAHIPPDAAAPATHRQQRRRLLRILGITWLQVLSLAAVTFTAVIVVFLSALGGILSYDPLRGLAATGAPGGLARLWPLLVYGPWLVASVSILRAAAYRRRAAHSWAVVVLFATITGTLCVVQAPKTVTGVAVTVLPALTILVSFHQFVRQLTLTSPPRHALPRRTATHPPEGR